MRRVLLIAVFALSLLMVSVGVVAGEGRGATVIEGGSIFATWGSALSGFPDDSWWVNDSYFGVIAPSGFAHLTVHWPIPGELLEAQRFDMEDLEHNLCEGSSSYLFTRFGGSEVVLTEGWLIVSPEDDGITLRCKGK